MMDWTRVSRRGLVLCGAAAGYLMGQCQMERSLVAEVRETTPRAAFQHGADRSEVVLREIHATLKVMDGRLERLEKNLQKRDGKN